MSKTTKKRIKGFCEAFNIVDYIINTDLSLDVDGDVNISNVGLSEIPFKFNNVTGDFNCACNHFTDMFNGPKYVGGFYVVAYNELESFEHFPLTVGKSVIAYENEFDLVNSLPDVEYDIVLDKEVEARIIKSQRLMTLNNIINE